MHYTRQLDKIGRMDSDISSNNFLGVFPADKIPYDEIRNKNFFLSSQTLMQAINRDNTG